MVVIIKSMLLESKRLLENFYRSKRLVNELELGYEKIFIGFFIFHNTVMKD